MNHIHQIIWNKTLGVWTVASELAKRGKKRSSIRREALILPLLLQASAGFALPTGNELVAGSANVTTPSAAQMQIDQSSQQAIINWQGFSIAGHESVNIQQPNVNAALLNRVVGQDASSIQGRLNANGQVYLTNPNGVIFSKTAQVDVGGLIASTHAISNQDFLNNKLHFTQDNATGSVINHGQIKTPDGGIVALIGEQVENTGSISTPKGTTALAAGKTVDLDMQGDGLVEVKITEAALNAQINNAGIIQADGGQVIMTAQAAGQLLNTVINNNGIVEARGLMEKDGKIVLSGGANGVVQVSGTLDASGQPAVNNVAQSENSTTQGGNITVSGEQIHINDGATLNADSAQINKQGNIQLVAQQDITLTSGSKLSANNSQGDAGVIHVESKTGATLAQGAIEAQAGQTGKGGNIELLGERAGVLDQASINASGENGGGKILVGGDYQGKNPDVHNAKATYIGKDTIIKADAISNGDGGKVIAWSNEATRAYGDISAKGGSQSGNGGFIETSGHWLDTAGIRINASAPHGQSGNWLLDPWNVTIANNGESGNTGGTFSSNTWTPNATGSIITPNTISVALDTGTSVNITTTGTGGEAGNITVANNISKAEGADATLKLTAHNAIIINNNVGISSTSNKLDVILNADADSNGAGNIQMGAGSSISTNGGNIIMGGGSCTTVGCSGAAVGYGSTTNQQNGIELAGAPESPISLNSGNGLIFLEGQGYGTGPGPNVGIETFYASLTTTGTGDLTLSGIGGNGTDSNGGLNMQNGTILSTTGTGNLSITGTGHGSGILNIGIWFSSATLNSGGNLTLNGTSDAGTDSNYGVGLVDTNLTTNGGTLSLTGASQGTGNSNFGIFTTSSAAFTSGAGSMILDGRGAGSAAGLLLGSGTVIGGDEGGQAGPITLIADTASGADSIVMQGATAPVIQGAGALTLKPLNNATSIGLKDGAGVFNLSSAELGDIRKGFTSLTIGNSAGTGLVTIGNGNVTFPGTGPGFDINILTPGAGSAGIIQQGGITADSGKNLVLASGGNYTNTSGAGALNVLGGGRWLVYAANPSSVTKNGLTSAFRQYNTVYGDTVNSTGNGFIYASAPGQLNVNTTLASGIASNTYGTAPTAVFGYAIGNPTIADNEDLVAISGAPAFTPTISSTTPASSYTINYLTGLSSAAGYTFAAGTGLSYTVNQALLNVAAIATSKTYGGVDPTLTYNATGFVNNESRTVLTGALSRAAGETVAGGPYAIGQGSLASSNYTIHYTAANFAITPATLIYTANPSSRPYGAANPPFTGTVKGFVNGELQSTVTTGTLSFTSLANNLNNVGSYAINGSGLAANFGNYTFTQAAGNATALSITPALLTITANDDRKIYNGLAYTGGHGVTYNGFVNNETDKVLSGSLNYSGNSQGAINAGAYNITPGGLSAGNYTITYRNGQLTIANNPIIEPPYNNNIVPSVTSVTYKPPLSWTPYEPSSVSVSSVLSVKDSTEEFAGITPQYCSDLTVANPMVNCQKRQKNENAVIVPTLKIKNSAGQVKRLQMSANKQFLSLLLEDGSVRIWDFQRGEQHQIVTQNKNQTLTDISAVDDKGDLLSISSKAGIGAQDIIIPTFEDKLAVNEPDIRQFMTSNDGSLLLVSAGANQLSLWDSKQNKKLWQLPYERGTVNGLALADNKRYGAVLSRQPGSYVLQPADLQLKSLTDAVDIVDLDTGKVIKSLPNVGEQIISMQFKDNDTLQLKLGSGELLDWSIATGSQKTAANFAETVTAVDADTKNYAYVLNDGKVRVGDGQGHVLLSIQNKKNPFKDAMLIEGDKKLLTVMANGELSLWDVASGKKMLRLFSTQQGWTVMDAFGRFDGSEDAMDNFSWTANEDDIPLDSFSENYYEPGLLSNVLQNQDYLNINPDMVKNGITLPPKVVLQIAEQQAKADSLALQLDVYDRGGGIDKIHVYQNGKILSNENVVAAQQSLQENDAEHRVLTLNITPSAGKNTLKVIAGNDMGIENSSTELSFDGKTKAYASSLRLLTIGIDQYSDDRLNLDYSVADADLIGQAIKNSSKIAASKNLYNENATKPKILAELKELSQGVQQDVLVIYFAGHGLALGKEWYFLPYETKMQPTLEKIAATGITATELSDIFKKSKIQHILLMVDSCYSGAGVDAFSKLQNGQRYFTRKLSRSLGITVMTAAAKDQKAFELKSLGHGLFTYLVSQELQETDATQPATAHGIAENIAKTLPVFSKKMLGSSQEPAVYAKGNDFILTDVLKESNKDNNTPAIAPKKPAQ